MLLTGVKCSTLLRTGRSGARVLPRRGIAVAALGVCQQENVQKGFKAYSLGGGFSWHSRCCPPPRTTAARRRTSAAHINVYICINMNKEDGLRRLHALLLMGLFGFVLQRGLGFGVT